MRGLVHVYFGNGKGKTTSSIGLACRFLGRGKKVLLVQFMKVPQEQFGQFGEIIFLSRDKNFSFKQFGNKDWVFKDRLKDAARMEGISALNFLKDSMASKEFDLIIADEVLYSVDMGLFSEDDVCELIKSKPKELELVLTGSHKPKEKVIALADYVSFVQKLKHPYDSGIIARECTEF